MIVSMEFVIVGRIVSQCQIHRDSLQSRLLGYVKKKQDLISFHKGTILDFIIIDNVYMQCVDICSTNLHSVVLHVL